MADHGRALSQQSGGYWARVLWQEKKLALNAGSEDTGGGILLLVPCRPGYGTAAWAPPWTQQLLAS